MDPAVKTIFVKNAGIIILAPFLENFFSALHLTHLTQFKTASHQSKAIAVLHYAATGVLVQTENELIIEQVLCGTTNNPCYSEITAAEIEETEALLHAVIMHSKVLKNSSIAGFRETFLAREGQLQSNYNTQTLVVEPSGVDILLDQLPWNIHLINTPWMRIPLEVEW
jgi:hypothetical protein